MNFQKILRRKEQIMSEISIYFKALFKFDRRNAKKFVIFAQGRTGSTLLVNLLDKHPDIKCDSEILHFKRVGKLFFPIKFVKSKAKLCEKDYYGFKVKIYQLNSNIKPSQNINPEKFIANLHKSGWKVIYLKRKNLLRQVISNRVRGKSGRPHFWTDEKVIIPKINIDYGILIEGIKRREGYLIDEEKILKNVPHLKVVYEDDLLNDKTKIMKKIFKYLGVSYYPVKTDLKRTSKDKLSDYILNYGEIREKISKTRYSKYLKGIS